MVYLKANKAKNINLQIALNNKLEGYFITLDFESNILLINTNYVKLFEIIVSLEMTGLQSVL